MITDAQKTFIINYFRSKPEIAAVYLFGSEARNEATQVSDIDLAVILNKNLRENKLFLLGGLEEELSSLLKRKVDVQDLDQAGNIFRFRVLSEGKIIFDRRGEEKFDFQTRAVNNYFELKPIYDEYYMEMGKRIKSDSFAKPYVQ